MALHCIFLKMNKVEHPFMCLFIICVSSLEKCLFTTFAHLLIRQLNFLLLSCTSSLFDYETKIQSDKVTWPKSLKFRVEPWLTFCSHCRGQPFLLHSLPASVQVPRLHLHIWDPSLIAPDFHSSSRSDHCSSILFFSSSLTYSQPAP